MTIILFYYVDTWPSHFGILIMGDFALLQTVFRRIVKVYDKNMFKNQVIFYLTVTFAVRISVLQTVKPLYYRY